MTVVEKNIIDIPVMKSFTKHNQNLLIIFSLTHSCEEGDVC